LSENSAWGEDIWTVLYKNYLVKRTTKRQTKIVLLYKPSLSIERCIRFAQGIIHFEQILAGFFDPEGSMKRYWHDNPNFGEANVHELKSMAAPEELLDESDTPKSTQHFAKLKRLMTPLKGN
jgi:hypothetical protein